jgi:hypothetical protein
LERQSGQQRANFILALLAGALRLRRPISTGWRSIRYSGINTDEFRIGFDLRSKWPRPHGEYRA